MGASSGCPKEMEEAARMDGLPRTGLLRWHCNDPSHSTSTCNFGGVCLHLVPEWILALIVPDRPEATPPGVATLAEGFSGD